MLGLIEFPLVIPRQSPAAALSDKTPARNTPSATTLTPVSKDVAALRRDTKNMELSPLRNTPRERRLVRFVCYFLALAS